MVLRSGQHVRVLDSTYVLGHHVWRLLVQGLGQSAQRAHTVAVHPEVGSFLHSL